MHKWDLENIGYEFHIYPKIDCFRFWTVLWYLMCPAIKLNKTTPTYNCFIHIGGMHRIKTCAHTFNVVFHYVLLLVLCVDVFVKWVCCFRTVFVRRNKWDFPKFRTWNLVVTSWWTRTVQVIPPTSVTETEVWALVSEPGFLQVS